MNKFIKIVFVVLIIITAIEIGYYVYLNINRFKLFEVNKSDSSLSLPTKISSRPSDLVKVIHPDVIESLSRISSSASSTAKVKIFIVKEEEYKVEDVEIGPFTAINREWEFGVKHDGNWDYSTKQRVEKMEIIINENGIEKPADLQDINIGDLIRTIKIYDASKSIKTSEISEMKLIIFR